VPIGDSAAVPKWEEYPHTPGVFARVANAGLTGYGTWKSVRRMGDRQEGKNDSITINSNYHAKYYHMSIIEVKIELKENWK
jgi:hypothetical protein